MLAKRKYISAFLSSTRSRTTRSGNKSGNEEEKYFRSKMSRRIPSRYCVSDRASDARPIRELPTGPILPNCIRLCIGALPPKWQLRCFGGREGDNALHPKLPAWRRLGWRGLGGSELADVGILEEQVEAFAGHFDRA